MRRLFFISLIVLLFVSSKPLTCDCGNEDSVKEALDKSHYVGLAFVGGEHEDYFFITPETIYKGDQFHILLKSEDGPCNVEFEIGKTYLLYAYQLQNKLNVFATNRCSRTREIIDPEDEELKVLTSMVPCKDTSIHYQGNIQRDLNPVCGCDGKMYGNYNEVFASGIRIRKPGGCK